MSKPTECYVVDVSNVCWDSSLPPFGHRTVASRLIRIVEALEVRSPGASIRCIADNSLKHAVMDASGSTWRREYRDRFSIEEVAVADERILEYASNEGSTVVSRDQFFDHRKNHPWIGQQPQRFIKPVRIENRIEFNYSGIRPASHHLVSQMIEVKELRQLGIDTKHHRNILDTRWRCENSSCLQARLWQDMLLLWPMVDRSGRAHCPSCRRPVTAIGRRPISRQLIAFECGTGAELFRFTVEVGSPIVIGRGALRSGISVDAVRPVIPRVERISRQHLLLQVTESGVVQARDLGSANGTRIRRHGSTDHRDLIPDSAANVNLMDSIDVAGAIKIELSGQRFIPDTNRNFPSGNTSPPPTELDYRMPPQPR